MRRLILVAGLIFADAHTPALAQTAAPIPRASFLSVMDGEFAKIDTDRNGQATRAEIDEFYRAGAAAEATRRNRAQFQQLDTDRNGQISPAEFAKATTTEEVNVRPLLAQYDSDKNGQISRVEYRSQKLSRFDGIDLDKDGVASVAEQRSAGLIK